VHKMKKRKIPAYFYCELFGSSVYFFVGWAQNDFVDYMKKNYNVETEINDSNGLTKQIIYKGTPIILVWVRAGKRLTATLVHESVHAANMILYVAGVRPSFVNDELQAYYVARLYKFGIETR
jgi:hypothetical protein